MNAKLIVKIAGFLLLLWLMWRALLPYYDNYWLKKTLEEGAQFGTINSIEKTRKKMTSLLKEDGWMFTGEDLYIEKDSSGTVTISVKYKDEINWFNLHRIDLDMSADATKAKGKKMF